jgi:hypothetical protein
MLAVSVAHASDTVTDGASVDVRALMLFLRHQARRACGVVIGSTEAIDSATGCPQFAVWFVLCVRLHFVILRELVANVVDQGSDTGSGNATGSECKGIYYKGNTSKGEAYEHDRVKEVSHC